MVVNPPKPGVSERSKIDSFIVMDLMRDADRPAAWRGVVRLSP